jgi:hypothetical protein
MPFDMRRRANVNRDVTAYDRNFEICIGRAALR